MARRLLIAGNWKLNKTVKESVDLARTVAGGLKRNDLEVLLCPTDLALHAVCQAVGGSPVLVGGQNIYWEDGGAYTGEASGPLLKAAGAGYVLVGHSERRQFFGETEKTANLRVRAALRAGLIPVLCVGETKEERETGQTTDVVVSQLAGGLAGLTLGEAAMVVLAYEPVWAIGTGLTASEAEAQEVHARIRSWVEGRFHKTVAAQTRILYGGSVKPGNAAGLLSQEDLDGVLVGGASLTGESFLGIIEAA